MRADGPGSRGYLRGNASGPAHGPDGTAREARGRERLRGARHDEPGTPQSALVYQIAGAAARRARERVQGQVE